MPFQDPSALIRFFQSVHSPTEAMAKEFASHFQFAEFGKGELLVEVGKQSYHYLFLEQGIMRSFLLDTEGNEVTTNFFAPGNVVLEPASFFLHVPSQEHIQALTDGSGWKINFDDLNKLFHALPAFRETGRAILVRALVSLKLRTLSMINQTAEQRYAELLSTRPEIFHHVPLKYIASYLGITDSSLSRIRKDFTAK